MDIQPIKNAVSHAAALAQIEALMSAKRDTPDGDRLDVLVTLMQAYEAKHHPIDPPDPIEDGSPRAWAAPPAHKNARPYCFALAILGREVCGFRGKKPSRPGANWSSQSEESGASPTSGKWGK